MRISDWSSDVCSSDLIGAGIDLWHLFSLFFVNPGSPARVQLALAGIHDPGGLGTRAVMEIFGALGGVLVAWRSEEHTSELQSLMRLSYAVFCLKKKKTC